MPFWNALETTKSALSENRHSGEKIKRTASTTFAPLESRLETTKSALQNTTRAKNAPAKETSEPHREAGPGRRGEKLEVRRQRRNEKKASEGTRRATGPWQGEGKMCVCVCVCVKFPDFSQEKLLFVIFSRNVDDILSEFYGFENKTFKIQSKISDTFPL